MYQSRINCQNCTSQKRQFYVFLECKHFLCLSCCLCLANFQTLQIRCCHRNTKMSSQLASILFEQVKKRKHPSELPIQNVSTLQRTIEQKLTLEKINNNCLKENYNNLQPVTFNQQVLRTTCPAPSFGTFGKLRLSQQNKQQIEDKSPKFYKDNNMDPVGKEQELRFERQIKGKTFNGIQEEFRYQLKNHLKPKKIINTTKSFENEDSWKQNHICWKNHQKSKDRILAKLNYHQQKMNTLMVKHFY